MTDAELEALERVLKNMLHGKSVLSKTQAIKPEGVLELIAELRQTRKERDWLADKLESIEWPLLTTWIEVAKEATCQK